MATKAQLKKKTKECAKDVYNYILEHIDKAFESGAFDVKDYEDNYLLPKCVICAILDRTRRVYEPPMKESKKLVKNIDYMM
jgi:hypothetical protein